MLLSSSSPEIKVQTCIHRVQVQYGLHSLTKTVTVCSLRSSHPPPEAFLLHSLVIFPLLQLKRMFCFLGQAVFSSLLFSVDFSLPSFPSETVFSTDFSDHPTVKATHSN